MTSFLFLLLFVALAIAAFGAVTALARAIYSVAAKFFG